MQSANNASLPGTITGTFTWDVNLGSHVDPGLQLLHQPASNPGDSLTLAVQLTSAISTAGRHPWQFQLTTPSGLETISGYSFVVPQDSSVFGAGWTFSNTNQLISIAADGANSLPAGELMAYGTGEFRFYSGTSTFTSPTGDNGTLTSATVGGTTTYTYTMADGETETFTSSGYETQWTSTDGKETLQYRYNGSNQLTGMTAIDGSTATFTYSSGKVSTITEPNTKTVTFTYSGTNLTSITNPDGGRSHLQLRWQPPRHRRDLRHHPE